MRCLLPALLLLLCLPVAAQASPPSGAYVEVDYAKVERRIAKEPSYLATPRYAMFVFDLAGQNRTWAVLDKSATDAPFYDVLYLDLDADGDLSEPGERFVGKRDSKLAPAGLEMAIRIAEIPVPGTALVHKKFLLATSPKTDRTGFWFQMRWHGEHEMSGGYGPLGMNKTAWGASPAKAPILRPCPFGPLHFATWGDDIIELRPGGATKVNVIIGNIGSGPDTLAVVDEHFVDLERDELTVTVIAKNKQGKTVSETSRIREHC